MSVQILPERLKEQRKYIKLSQKDLASRIGYQKQAISRWECSDKPVNIRNRILPALAHALSCTTDYLEGAAESKNKTICGEKKLGLPLSRKPDIQEHIRNYSDEKLLFLYDFLKIIDISNSDHLKLIKRICSAIVTTDLSISMIRHPLCDWELFHNSFKNTLGTIEKFREEVRRYFPTGELPGPLVEAFNLCSQSISDEYNVLSKPFQNEKNLKKSLKNLPQKFEYLIGKIDEQNSIPPGARRLLKEGGHDAFDAALDSDIKELIQILHEPI